MISMKWRSMIKGMKAQHNLLSLTALLHHKFAIDCSHIDIRGASVLQWRSQRGGAQDVSGAPLSG